NASRTGLQQARVARSGVGRLGLSRAAHDRRARAAPPREARAGPRRADAAPDRARRRVPVHRLLAMGDPTPTRGRELNRPGGMRGFSSLRVRLIGLRAAVVVTALGVVFLYVVPSLRANLIAQRLDALVAIAATQ